MDKKHIRNLALQNAIKFNGKANPGAVIGHIISNDPKAKANIKEIAKKVNEVIKEVNKLSLNKQNQELIDNAPELLKEKKHEKKQGLKPLKKAKEGKVIMRFAPSPSGPMHIGHAFGISLSSEYCRKYKGKLILRIEDTNPDNIYEPAYKLIPEDGKWITKNNIKEIIIQSDRLETYYKYFEKLLELEKVYICTCNPEKYKELITNSQACHCRSLNNQKQRWKDMFKKYKQGEAVARVKTDLAHKNPAMRDFPVFRINESSHPKQKKKYRVWPLMNMSVTVDDIESNMTHIIRAKEHADNAKRQEYIYNYLKKPIPETLFVGRINFIGMPVSCSKTKQAIQEGKYKDWDDIKLPFLLALKRRGYQPESFIKYAEEVGVSLTDKTVSKEDFFKSINSFNRNFIDKKADRYFFIQDPKKIKIKGAPKKEIKIAIHPDFKERGNRTLKTDEDFYIEDKIEKGKNYRLMHLLNFKNNELISEEIDETLKTKMIHWLPVEESLIKTEILMDTGKTIKGLSEPDLKKAKIGDIVQFERFGFCRLDEISEKRSFSDDARKNHFSDIKNKVYKFWFTHK